MENRFISLITERADWPTLSLPAPGQDLVRLLDQISGLGGTVLWPESPTVRREISKGVPPWPGAVLLSFRPPALRGSTFDADHPLHAGPGRPPEVLQPLGAAFLATLLGLSNDEISETYGFADTSRRRALDRGHQYWIEFGAWPWAVHRRRDFPTDRWHEDATILKALTTWVIDTGIKNRSIADKFPSEAREQACRKIGRPALDAEAIRLELDCNRSHVEDYWRTVGYGDAPPEYRPFRVVSLPSPPSFTIRGLELFEAFMIRLTGQPSTWGPLATARERDGG